VLPRGRRWSVRALFVLGTILLVLSQLALFADRQLLNADNWADTSDQILQNSEVRSQVSNYLVDQLYSETDVSTQVADALPPQLKPLAGPLSGGLRELSLRTTNTLLGRPRVQDLWKEANRLTAQQFINIAEDKSKAITQQGNAVVLDLRPLLLQLIERLGLPKSLEDKVPPDAAKIKIMSGNQVKSVQNAASALNGLAVVLPLLGFICLGLAVYLSAGRRRRTLLIVGILFITVGAVVLIVRNIAGNGIVESLVKQDSVKPAAHAVWDIGTRLLQQVGQATIVIGIPLVFAAWLAGTTRPAVAFRRWSAPYMREQVGAVYTVVAAIVLLVIAWGPIPATRNIITVLIMIALVIVGVEALRRQTEEEFPAVAAAGSPAADGHGDPTAPPVGGAAP
jgi:hypothetical protein